MPKKGGSKAAEQARMQTRAFTTWANAQLKVKGVKIEDITKDLSDGLVLCQLLSAPCSRSHMIPSAATQ